jgi:hypothetical protein
LSCNHTDNADTNAGCVIEKRTKEFIRTEAFSKEKTVRNTTSRKNKKVVESSSSGFGEDVSLELVQANLVDALNKKSTFAAKPL